MDAENLIPELARFAIFEGALPSTRPEDIIHLAGKVRNANAGRGIDLGVEKFLWVHEKEALRMFGPNPAGAATAIRSSWSRPWTTPSAAATSVSAIRKGMP